MNRCRVASAVLLALSIGAPLGLQGANAPDAQPAASAKAQARQGKDPAAQWQHPRIDDAARILEPFGPRLGRMADSFYDDLGVDIHVVTRMDAQPSIEMQADQAFQQRRIGAGAPTGGLLVILNPKLAGARIEVGYTLEGGLTDLHVGRIARDQLAPYTSYGAAGMATMDVLHYLRDQVYLSAALGNLTLGENYRKKPAYREYEKFLSGGAGARAALSAVPADADLKRAIPKNEQARYAPSANMEESVAAFLRATADLAGDPTLELFTEGSRMMRAYYPFARFEELQRLKRIEGSKPLHYLHQEDYAVATSKKPVAGFAPILLHREQGLWRIDLVETWKNLFFNNEGNYYLRNSNTPYAFGLKQFGAGYGYDIAPLPLRGRSIEQALAAVKGKQDVVSILYRAEYWLRNSFVFPKAYPEFETARRTAPKDPLVLQLIGERTLYLGFPELAAGPFQQLGRGFETWAAEAYIEMGDLEGARRAIASALKEDPLETHALRWQKFIEEKAGRKDAALRIEQTLAKLAADPARSANPVVLYFDPRIPSYDPVTTMDVAGTKVFDHSNFGVTMHNTSKRGVLIESVTLTSTGNAKASGLGDIKNYWRYPSGQHRLAADESIYFKKLWGFTVDTHHEHVRYLFRTCWHGVDTPALRQCRTQFVDTMPKN